MSISPINSISSAWEVLMLFLIPVGGGIPGGVLLAQERNLAWPVMAVLYFISDIILAFLFEPVMLLVISLGKQSSFLARLSGAMKKSMQKTTALYGTSLGPLALIMVSFGSDPMTGRTAAVVAGHGFVTGWALAIMGDMIYFSIIMVSTLWLSTFLGDGTWTMVIILLAMTVVPVLVRRIRQERQR